MDKALVDKLYAAAQSATRDPKLRALFAEQGAEATDLGPEDLKKFMASEILKWSEVIGKMGIAPM
jgi:tripartite-type tricarboxylate transporter receptor subunit TctC